MNEWMLGKFALKDLLNLLSGLLVVYAPNSSLIFVLLLESKRDYVNVWESKDSVLPRKLIK